GAINQRKNVGGLMDALAKANELRGRKDLKVAWAGALNRAEISSLRTEARRARVEDQIHLMGFVEDQQLAACYRGARALAFVSHREGFGYPVVEAMATGCPVITSNRSAMLEVAGNAAWMVDPDDRDQIADALVLASDDPKERNRLKQAGLERVPEFSVDKMVENTLLSYERSWTESL
ncbi:MAG: glycosyltransferase family 4 protein, partial [Polyangiaceae bacterium]|nr:glycosyltransferase family 4 protein [Polyangiaceae bacterium]